MSNPDLGVVAVGNALVDVLAKVPDDFVSSQNGMQKGTMALIDTARAEQLYTDMPAGIESSGGSGGNTMAGFASFGGQGGFIGKVADDQLGQIFKHDLQSMGIQFDTSPLVDGEPTGRCLILVTPDAERTMNTFLGASAELSASDIDESLIARAAVTYLEGYLYDRDAAKQAFITAAEYAHKAGRRVSLTLSDPFCVDRHRDDFLNLVEGHVDILFANEDEIKGLYQTDDFEDALSKVKGHCEVAAITRGAQGAVILSGNDRVNVSAQNVETVVDTTGAGDQFAAGFLYGFTLGKSMLECGRLGTIAAAEVISHMGPRPEVSYASLLRAA